MATTSYLKNAPLKDKMPRTWDVAVFQEGEADLYKHHKSCKKYPDHKDFIPVDAFDTTHLPTDYQDRDIVEYIKLVAQLTVHLTVEYVSPDRPATIPGTDIPYPSYELRGKHRKRVGTGVITGYYSQRGISILTATHLVFDDEEVKYTSCRLFYDSGENPADTDNVIELKNLSSIASSGNSFTDKNVLFVHVYEEHLKQKIESNLIKLHEIQKSIKMRVLQNSYGIDNKSLTLIVSHPHGCSKKISFGECVEVDDNLDDVRFLYTTPTCEGSSGAAVVCLDKLGFRLNSIHLGTWDKELNLGASNYDPLWGYGQPVPLGGFWGAPDGRLPHTLSLYRHPLPEELNHNLVRDYINTFTHLCSIIDVEDVSEQRPEFWPGSKLKYPFYNQRGRKMKRRGNCWVDRVDIYPKQSCPYKTCDCDKCRNSSTPERKFAHIRMVTSSSLVFDQAEGKFIKCFLNYQLHPILDQTQFVWNNIETDRSELVFVTHDLVIAGALKSLREHVSLLKEKVQVKLFNSPLANPICIKIRTYGDYSTGCLVRVGKHFGYTNKAEKDDVGAPVIVLGYNHLDVDVCGHTGQYPHDPLLGYSRYLNYRYK